LGPVCRRGDRWRDSLARQHSQVLAYRCGVQLKAQSTPVRYAWPTGVWTVHRYSLLPWSPPNQTRPEGALPEHFFPQSFGRVAQTQSDNL
jgi:hypothetical protein